jgi:hypothetical protein
MAIQVSGTEVISNARALNNIASIDATTAASIIAGGVGGDPAWVTGGTTYTTSNYLTNYSDSGWLDVSSILTSMPSSPSKIMIKATWGSNIYPSYWTFGGNTACALRIGASSGSYIEVTEMGAAKGAQFTSTANRSYSLTNDGFNGSPPAGETSGKYVITGGNALDAIYPSLGQGGGSKTKNVTQSLGTITTIGYVAVYLQASDINYGSGSHGTSYINGTFQVFWQV